MNKFQSCSISKLANLIKSVLQTEKTLKLFLKKKIYTFIITKKINKPELKKILEKCFFIKIKKVRSINLKKNSLKKVYIYLQDNSPLLEISLFQKILS